MSANNMAYCPSCMRNRIDRRNELQSQINDLYGKVTAEEFDQLRQEYESLSGLGEMTLAEYYEIGFLSTGKFIINYGAMCDICGFRYSYNDKDSLMAQPSAQ